MGTAMTTGSTLLESNAAEMCFFVSAKNGAQHFLGEPAIEQVKLLLVVYVFEVVIEDSDITDTFFHGFRGDGGEQTGAGMRVGFAFPAAAFTAKGETEKILNFPGLVAGERHDSADAK